CADRRRHRVPSRAGSMHARGLGCRNRGLRCACVRGLSCLLLQYSFPFLHFEISVRHSGMECRNLDAMDGDSVSGFLAVWIPAVLAGMTLRQTSITAPRAADPTVLAYFAKTPR